MPDEVFSAVFTDREAADAIIALIPSSGDSTLASARALDGSAGEWIVLATAAINALVPLVAALRDLAGARRVKSIKVGEVEIVNPSRDQVDQLLASYGQKQVSPYTGHEQQPS